VFGIREGREKKEPRKVSEIKFKQIRYGEDSCGIPKEKTPRN
jgi:hypothetical protein